MNRLACAGILFTLLAACACDTPNPCAIGRYDPGPPRACILPDGGRIELDDAGVAAEDGGLDGGRADAGSAPDGSTPDAACGAPLGTTMNCASCGDTCGWACEGECNDAVDVSVRGRLSCAVREDGSVPCWGAIPTGSGLIRIQPIAGSVNAFSGPATAVHVGTCLGAFVCAMVGDGVECWGSNMAGELGGESTAPFVPLPMPVLGLRGVVAELLGGQCRTCARLVDGRVDCWGFGPTAPLTEVPVGTTAVALGGSHQCVIADGSVHCWGQNNEGQLGDGTLEPRTGPTRVVGLPGTASQLVSGFATTCAIASSLAYCWGAGDLGQLADGPGSPSPRPIAIPTAPGVRLTAMATNGATVCAVDAEGLVYCWGDNSTGLLATAESVRGVHQVRGLPSAVRHVVLGATHACALLVDGGVVCWGDSAEGQLGDGMTTTRLVPTRVLPPSM